MNYWKDVNDRARTMTASEMQVAIEAQVDGDYQDLAVLNIAREAIRRLVLIEQFVARLPQDKDNEDSWMPTPEPYMDE